MERARSIGDHARQFYKYVTGEPPIFFLFDHYVLPQESMITHNSSNGDQCHYNVTEVSNNKLWKFFKKYHWSEFYVCNNGGFRQLEQADVDAFPIWKTAC